jgi:hypothetical protein
MKVWDFLTDFMIALKKQLVEDDMRWGDTWLHRKVEGREERTEVVFKGYFDQYKYAGTPVPWLKIAGGALICWIRENHPEIWKE